MVGRADRGEMRIVKEIPKTFGWAGVSFEKKDFRNYIQVQERTTKTGERIGIEYMLVEGRLKIFNEVCLRNKWHYEISYELEEVQPVEQSKSDGRYEPKRYFVTVKCSIIVKDQNNTVLYHVNSYNMDEVAIGTNDFKKLQTNALGRCLNLLGVGLEIAIEDEDDVAVEPPTVQKPTRRVIEPSVPEKPSTPPKMSVADMYQKLLVMAKENPELIDMIKEELAFYGVKKFTDLTDEQARAVYELIASPNNDDLDFSFGEERF